MVAVFFVGSGSETVKTTRSGTVVEAIHIDAISHTPVDTCAITFPTRRHPDAPLVAIRRVTVRGGDVTGVELNLASTSSIAGQTSLRRSQLDAAKKGNATMLIWLGKQYLGQADKPTPEESDEEIAWCELRKSILAAMTDAALRMEEDDQHVIPKSNADSNTPAVMYENPSALNRAILSANRLCVPITVWSKVRLSTYYNPARLVL